MKTSGSGTDRITVEEAAERTGHGREDEAARRVDTSVLLDVRELASKAQGRTLQQVFALALLAVAAFMFIDAVV